MSGGRDVLTRRQSLVLGAGGAFGLAACSGGGDLVSAKSGGETVLSAYAMPLESEPHTRTFMQWPVSTAVYGRAELAAVQASITTIANAIAQFEPVILLGATGANARAKSQLSGSVELWDIATDDLWCRDSGPTFVVSEAGKLAVAHIKFNGWGNKQGHANDGLVAQRVAERLGVPLLDTGLIGEQGGVEHDGNGLLLAHESSWVNPNRNRQTRDEIGDLLCGALGGEKIIWARGVKGADITDYHIDALARFVGPSTVLIQIDDEVDQSDPWSKAAHGTLAVLEQARDLKGQPLKIIKLPEPRNIRSRAPDFVSSYINYYVCNGAVIAAQFGDAQADAHAKSALQGLYPSREIVMLNIDPIGEAGGGIHCATQQQPAV